MIKLVVFDLDGTLLDSVSDITNSCNFALRELGYPEHTVEEVTTYIGNGAYKLVERCLPDNIDKTPEKIKEIHSIYREHYAKNQMNTTKPFEGITELIQDLTKKNIKLAVLSNKTHSSTIEITKSYFPDSMEVILGRRDGVPAKPDPKALLEIMDICKVQPDETVYVGDSGVDMQVGINAGVHTYGVDWGYQPVEVLRDAGAHKILSSAEELYEAITG